MRDAGDPASSWPPTTSTGERSSRWPSRGGATAVIVPWSPAAVPDVPDYFSLVDRWVNGLAAAFTGGRLMIDLLLAPFIAAMIILLTHAYFGLHIIQRGVIFVDLALAQIARPGGHRGVPPGSGARIGHDLPLLLRLHAPGSPHLLRVPHEGLPRAPGSPHRHHLRGGLGCGPPPGGPDLGGIGAHSGISHREPHLGHLAHRREDGPLLRGRGALPLRLPATPPLHHLLRGIEIGRSSSGTWSSMPPSASP